MYGDPLFRQHPFERTIIFELFRVRFILPHFAERQRYKYRFCPQPLTLYHGEGGTGMSNCCDAPTHSFDEHHLLAVSYMLCGLAGKENTTTAENYTIAARKVRSFRAADGGERTRSKIRSLISESRYFTPS
eukprot:4947385-Pleurochrysis_carterae.AAC.1